MGIKKVFENGKAKYEVIVKIRDKSGKQVTRKKKWFFSEAAAKKAELEFRMELEDYRTKVTWEKWIERVLEKYRIESNPQYNHSLQYEKLLNQFELAPSKEFSNNTAQTQVKIELSSEL